MAANCNDLALIVQYKLSKKETFAFQLALFYVETVRKYFPKFSISFNHGDPRKKELWKYCHKLITDVDLNPEDYYNYIEAQISILKNSSKQPFINPNCLIGETAWRRWMVWKKYFNHTKVA